MAESKKHGGHKPAHTKKHSLKRHSPKAHAKAGGAVLWAKIQGWHKWQKICLYVLLFLIIFFSLSTLIDRMWRPIKDPVYGTSFSIEYAQELGSDWQANYKALLDDMDFKHLRLMTYWETIESTQGHYDFKDLDWQVNQATAHGAKISLAMGLRQPRWPECHEPDWAAKMPAESAQWRNSLYSYMKVVVDHYKNNPTIESYQLENEAANGWFGYCRGGVAPKDRLNQEFKLMKTWDPGHPTWMSLGDEHGFPLGTPVPDAYGFSIYRVVYSTNTPIHFYVTYPITIWYHRARAFLINHIKGRPVYVHELQLEPWGSRPTKEMTISEQNRSMSVAQIHRSIEFSLKTGIKDQYMWGSEWWYWRKVHFNDSGPWNAIKQETQKAQQS